MFRTFAAFLTDYAMNYQETTAWLFSQLPMYQREGAAAYKANLDNTIALDNHFGHPHTQYKTIHVAGTNGKGSVSHTLASIMQEAGYKTGLYTSPHLKDFRERIKVNGKCIPEQYVVDFVAGNKGIFTALKPSFFEMTVALAFKYFADERVDVAVIEVGLGGRLDSTNIISPLVSVITNISLDHIALLGNTLPAIATEKAGIIKEGIPAVVGVRDSDYDFVFTNRAEKCHTSLTFASDEWHTTAKGNGVFDFHRRSGETLADVVCELKGGYQRENLPTVLETVRTLGSRGITLDEEMVRRGIAKVVTNTGLHGRWEQLSAHPYTICDTGHNIGGFREITSQLTQCRYRTLRVVFGMVNDKDVDGVLSMLPKEARYYFCKASIPRAMPETVLAAKAAAHGLSGTTYTTVAAAYAAARHEATDADMIYIGGSTFVVAEVV